MYKELTKIFLMFEADPTIKNITKYLDPKKTLRVSRRLKPRARATRSEYVVTVGAPNYLAVRFIKLAVKVGEPFPVKKLQVKYYAVPSNKSAKKLAK